jgi:hypothetical protein
MLFRFSAPCRYRQALWSPSGIGLEDSYRLPSLIELDGGPTFADVRAAWNDQGLVFSAVVWGKRHAPWCRDNQMDESDGLHVWIDTRDTHNIHRATRFCHWFAFLPTGGGERRQDPVAGQMAILHAREQARPASRKHLLVRSEKRIDGYLIEAFIAAEGLTGYDPAEHPRLGFQYAIVDRERGDVTWSVGGEFHYEEDPSLWGTLELVK